MFDLKAGEEMNEVIQTSDRSLHDHCVRDVMFTRKINIAVPYLVSIITHSWLDGAPIFGRLPFICLSRVWGRLSVSNQSVNVRERQVNEIGCGPFRDNGRSLHEICEMKSLGHEICLK
jgi:hypothetical protein